MKKIVFVAALSCLQSLAFGQTPDWSTKVAPILYNHCTSCHHAGGIAPFSLLTYAEAMAYGPAMKNDVQNNIMPPWPPDKNYSRMAHERTLSATEINTIANWVTGGMPQGSPSLAPPTPTYTNHGMISGTPDLIVKIPTYTSTATSASGDVYQCFTIPSHLVSDKYIRAFEAIPGNPSIVHHVLVYSDTTGTCASLDAASAGPGYPNFGGVGTDQAVMLGGWVPGSQPMSYPSGFGVRIARNADIVVQIHYPAGSATMKDSTEVHFYFAPTTTPLRNVSIQPLLYHGLNITSPLSIPANTTKSFLETMPGAYTSLMGDMTLLGMAPHMHLIGQNIKSYGVHPAGDTDQFIRINKWDFHWQGFYMLPKLKKIEAGTALYAEAFYDNTTANPENPSSPPRNVTAGEATTDEMMLVFFVYTNYAAGDENIIADSSFYVNSVKQVNNYYHGQELLDVCPNPAISDIVVKCHFEEADHSSITLMDMQGRVVKQFLNNETINQGYTAYKYSIAGIPAGTYSLVLSTGQTVLSQKLVVIH